MGVLNKPQKCLCGSTHGTEGNWPDAITHVRLAHVQQMTSKFAFRQWELTQQP